MQWRKRWLALTLLFRYNRNVAGTNTRSALPRHAPRRPCCSLCCARARSGLKNDAVARRFRCELGLVAPLLPAAPLFPACGIAPSPVANVPTEATRNDQYSSHLQIVDGEFGNIKNPTGRLKQTSRRLRSSLDLSAFAKGSASRISRAPPIRCATKMTVKMKDKA